MVKSKNGQKGAEKSSMVLSQEEEAKEVVEKLSHFVNSFSFPAEEFARLVCSQHPTLQQNMMRAFTTCIRQWAKMKKEGYFDLRNEQTVSVCSMIVRDFDQYLYFPLI